MYNRQEYKIQYSDGNFNKLFSLSGLNFKFSKRPDYPSNFASAQCRRELWHK